MRTFQNIFTTDELEEKNQKKFLPQMHTDKHRCFSKTKNLSHFYDEPIFKALFDFSRIK